MRTRVISLVTVMIAVTFACWVWVFEVSSPSRKIFYEIEDVDDGKSAESAELVIVVNGVTTGDVLHPAKKQGSSIWVRVEPAISGCHIEVKSSYGGDESVLQIFEGSESSFEIEATAICSVQAFAGALSSKKIEAVVAGDHIILHLESTAVIRGYVVDQRGLGIEAHINVGKIKTQSSEEDGSYLLENVPYGTVRIDCSPLDPTLKVLGKKLQLFPEDDLSLDLVAITRRKMRGRIVDVVTGDPIEGARVVDQRSGNDAVAFSDSDGFFETPVWAAGQGHSALITITKDGYIRKEGPIVSARVHTWKLRPGIYWSGRVVDSDNKPVEGAFILALWDRGRSFGGHTAEDGSFSVCVPESELERVLYVAKIGKGSVYLKRTSVGAPEWTEIVLREEAILVATLVDAETGEALALEKLKLHPPEKESWRKTVSRWTDTSGRVIVRGLEPGIEYEEDSTGKIVKLSSGVNILEFRMHVLEWFRGSVRDHEGQAIAGARVFVRGARSTYTGPNGKFRLNVSDSPRGARLTVSPPVHLEHTFLTFRADRWDQQKNNQITLSPARVINIRIKKNDGEAIRGAQITAQQDGFFGSAVSHEDEFVQMLVPQKGKLIFYVDNENISFKKELLAEELESEWTIVVSNEN